MDLLVILCPPALESLWWHTKAKKTAKARTMIMVLTLFIAIFVLRFPSPESLALLRRRVNRKPRACRVWLLAFGVIRSR